MSIDITNTLTELQKKIAGLDSAEAIDIIRGTKAALVSNNFLIAYDSVSDFPSSSLLAYSKGQQKVFKNLDGTWTEQKFVPPAPAGTDVGYHTAYLALTSGNLTSVTYAGSGVQNLNATIDAMTDGDALLLEPGEYEIDGIEDTTDGGRHTNDYIRMRNIAICGKTFDPADIIIHLREGSAPSGYDPIFGAYSGTDTNWLRHFSHVRLIRYSSDSTAWATAIDGYHNGDTKGYAKNVIFDFNSGIVSWKYNNSGGTSKVKVEDCSFVNYSAWLSSYSGQSGQLVVEDCAFDYANIQSDGINTSDGRVTFIGTNTQGVNFDADYNYTPTTSGHLNDATTSASVSISSPP